MVSLESWAVGDGRSINIWKDRWLFQDKSLENYIEQVPPHMECWTVSDLVDDLGAWNLSLLDGVLAPSLIRTFDALLPPNHDIGPDVRLWLGKKLGEFCV